MQYSSISSADKLLPIADKCLITCKEQCTLTKETGECTECPALQKKNCGRKYKKHLLSPSRKTKSNQTIASVFAERIKLVKKNKIDLEKSVDCFQTVLIFMVVIL